MENDQRVVCITGGYGRLGVEFAKAFVAEGDAVIITGRNVEKLRKAAEEIGCERVTHDITCENDTAAVREFIDHKFGKLDLLINNAGVMRSRPVTLMQPSLFLDVLKTNLYGSYLSTHILLPILRKSSGALIINIGSTSGHRANPGSAAYNASQFGLLGFTEALRMELRTNNIRVTSISPSSIYFGELEDSGSKARLAGCDVAATAVHLANTPDRVLIRDIEMWSTKR